MPGKKILMVSMAATKLEEAIAFLVSLVETESIPTAAGAVHALSIYRRNERVRKAVTDAVLAQHNETLANHFRHDFDGVA